MILRTVRFGIVQAGCRPGEKTQCHCAEKAHLGVWQDSLYEENLFCSMTRKFIHLLYLQYHPSHISYFSACPNALQIFGEIQNSHPTFLWEEVNSACSEVSRWNSGSNLGGQDILCLIRAVMLSPRICRGGLCGPGDKLWYHSRDNEVLLTANEVYKVIKWGFLSFRKLRQFLIWWNMILSLLAINSTSLVFVRQMARSLPSQSPFESVTPWY